MAQEELINEVLKLTSKETTLNESQDSDEKIESLISKLTSESIREVILKVNGLQQLSVLFSIISQHTSSISNESNQFIAIKASIEILCTVNLNASANKVSELVQSICLEIDDLTENEVPSVMSVFIQYFDFDGTKLGSQVEDQMKQVLDILPKLLSMCESTTILVDDEIEGGGVSLTEYKNHYIEQIINRQWSADYICTLLSVLRECQISDDLIIATVNKISALLNKTKETLVSNIIYQILLLTNDNVGRVVLMSLLLNIRKKCKPSLFPAIINQFSFALKNKTTLCKIFLELMKNMVLPLTTYSLFILLSLTDTEKYRHLIWTFLINQLQHEYESQLMNTQYPISICENIEIRKISDLFSDLCDIIDNGYNEGSDLLIHFYEYILHWNGKCDSTERLWLNHIAGKGLIMLFTRIASSRANVLTMLVNEMNKHTLNETCFNILNTICNRFPTFVLSSIPLIKTLVSRIPLMLNTMVPPLIQSIHSLLPNRPDLVDMLIIILKKCCYQSDDNIRLSGISGLIELLCKSTPHKSSKEQAITLTQVGSTVIETTANPIHQTTIEDTMNLIHRFSNSLHSTESISNSQFYKLLLKLFWEAPSTRTRIVLILIEKLRLFVDKQVKSQQVPISKLLKLDEICANGVIQQPIHDIIAVTALILHPENKVSLIHIDEDRKRELTELFNLFMEQLVHSEIEEFGFDKGANYNPNEMQGRTNLCKRQVLTSLYLTAVYVRTSVFSEMKGSSQSLNSVRVLTLGQIMTLLNNIIKMNKLIGEKTKDPYYSSIFESISIRPTLQHLLELVVSTNPADTCEEITKAISLILDDYSIMSFIITAVSTTISNFSAISIRSRENQHFCSYCKTISEDNKHTPVISPMLLSIAPTIFKFLSNSSLLRFYPLANHHISNINSLQTILDLNEQVCKDLILANNELTVKDLLKTLHSLFTNKYGKITAMYIKWIELLIMNCSSSTTELFEILTWLRDECNNTEYNEGIVSYLYSLLCQIAIHTNKPIELILPISQRIVIVMNDKEEQNMLSSDLNNASFIIQIIITALQDLLKPTTFLSTSCKFYQVKNAIEQDRITHLLKSYYSDWRKKSVQLVNLLLCLSQCLLPLLKCTFTVETAEVLLGYLKGYYTLVDQTVKQVAYAGDNCPIQILTQLAEIISEYLTPSVYSLIHVVQKPGTKESHIRKQAKLIPELIYAIEQYEATLIQINKRTKGIVNLTMFVKRSTARDFRIDSEKLSKKMEHKEQEDDNSDSSSKRQKTDFIVCFTY